MPLTLRSQATDDLLLLNDLAKALLGAFGKDASQPGILQPEDMPAALVVLRGLPDGPTPPDEPAAEPGELPAHQAEPSFADEPVPLRRRAVPLVRMIEFALAERKPIVWGV